MEFFFVTPKENAEDCWCLRVLSKQYVEFQLLLLFFYVFFTLWEIFSTFLIPILPYYTLLLPLGFLLPPGCDFHFLNGTFSGVFMPFVLLFSFFSLLPRHRFYYLSPAFQFPGTRTDCCNHIIIGRSQITFWEWRNTWKIEKSWLSLVWNYCNNLELFFSMYIGVHCTWEFLGFRYFRVTTWHTYI